jgi:hypothetical protein
MSPTKKCSRKSAMTPSYACYMEMLVGDLEKHDQDKEDIGKVEKSKQKCVGGLMKRKMNYANITYYARQLLEKWWNEVWPLIMQARSAEHRTTSNWPKTDSAMKAILYVVGCR